MVSISQAKVYESPAIRKLEKQVSKDKDLTGKHNDLTKFSYVLLAKEKNKVIAVLFATKTSKEEIYIEELIIHPKWQHQGIEKRLYETLFASCGNIPFLTSIDTNNEASIKFHKELGFTGVKKVKKPFGINKETTSFLMKREKR